MPSTDFVWGSWHWVPKDAISTVEKEVSNTTAYDREAVLSQIHSMVHTISNLYAYPQLQEKYIAHWKQKAIEELEAGDILRNAPEGATRVEKGTIDLGLRNVARFYEVESDYYSWTLERRMLRMNAPSINHLCKTLFFENTRYIAGNSDLLDPTNSKYYVVVVQYTGKLNSAKLTNFVRALSNGTKKNFNLRVASEAESDEFTGYRTGGVAPLGMARKVPVILSRAILDLAPRVFFMGCGHVDWKVAVPVDDFVKATGCFVVDLE
ncbi:UNVERIFIED_CONTAM: hypothetical protein HDU68_012513 [Siphonaria sp. JEL0065]|nr:hypothetical protein HDU68_012513 [Siphonaria sp. JEL0065]